MGMCSFAQTLLLLRCCAKIFSIADGSTKKPSQKTSHTYCIWQAWDLTCCNFLHHICEPHLGFLRKTEGKTEITEKTNPHKKKKKNPESSETPALTDQGKSQSLQPFSKSKPHRCFLRFKTTPPASRYPLSPNLNWEKRRKEAGSWSQQQRQISTTTARTPPHPPPFVLFRVSSGSSKGGERESERECRGGGGGVVQSSVAVRTKRSPKTHTKKQPTKTKKGDRNWGWNRGFRGSNQNFIFFKQSKCNWKMWKFCGSFVEVKKYLFIWAMVIINNVIISNGSIFFII